MKKIIAILSLTLLLVVQAQTPHLPVSSELQTLQAQIFDVVQTHNAAVVDDDLSAADIQADTEAKLEPLYAALHEATAPVRHAMTNPEQGVSSFNMLGNLRRARRRANESAAQAYVRNCVTALEVARDSTTGALPFARSCEDDVLGDAALHPFEAVLHSRVVVENDDVYSIYVISANGTLFTFGFERRDFLDEIMITPAHLRTAAKLYVERCARAFEARYPDDILLHMVSCADIMPDSEVETIHLLLMDGIVLLQDFPHIQVSVVDIAGNLYSRNY